MNALSDVNKNENLQSNARGIKRKTNDKKGNSFLPIKQPKTSLISQQDHRNDNVCTSVPFVEQQRTLRSQHHKDNVSTLPVCTSDASNSSLNIQNTSVSNLYNANSTSVSQSADNSAKKCSELKKGTGSNAKESKMLNCNVPGCEKKLPGERAYEIHMKHFHGVFNFNRSEPIVTAYFYECNQNVTNKHDNQKSNILKSDSNTSGLKSAINNNDKSSSSSQCSPSTPILQDSKSLNISNLDMLLPASLMNGMVTVPVVKKIVRQSFIQKKKKSDNLKDVLNSFVNEMKGSSSFESDSVLQTLGDCEKTNYHSEMLKKLQELLSLTEKCDNKPQSNSDTLEYILPDIISDVPDNLKGEITQGRVDPEPSQEIYLMLTNNKQEDHLHTGIENKEVYESYEDFINKKQEEFVKKNAINYLGSNVKEEKKTQLKISEKLAKDVIECKNRVLSLELIVGSSADVYGYEEFVNMKEKECLNVASPLLTNFTLQKLMNGKQPIVNTSSHNQKKIADSKSSFNSIVNLKPSIKGISCTENNNDVNEALKFCKTAKNLREILLKCKEHIDFLGNYIIRQGKSVDGKISTDVSEEKDNELLHYIFFLDVLNDKEFPCFVKNFLNQSERKILKNFKDKVLIYLKNTQTELPNVKLRRDREFLQRNSEFFSILLKIQKSSDILQYADTSISVEQLYHPPTKLRLEKSDHFAKLFLDVKNNKAEIFMQSYGAEKDLSISPCVNLNWDKYNVHKLAGFVMLKGPEDNITNNMCVGLCFKSATLSFKDCADNLTNLSQVFVRKISEVQAELCALDNTKGFQNSKMKANLLAIFNLISTEAKSVFSVIDVISHFAKKPQRKHTKKDINLIQDSITQTGKIFEDLNRLKECETLS